MLFLCRNQTVMLITEAGAGRCCFHREASSGSPRWPCALLPPLLYLTKQPLRGVCVCVCVLILTYVCNNAWCVSVHVYVKYAKVRRKQRQGRTTPELPSVVRNLTTPWIEVGMGGTKPNQGDRFLYEGQVSEMIVFHIHVYLQIFEQRPSRRLCQRVSLQTRRCTIIMAAHTKCLSRVHECFSFPMIRPSLYTPNTCPTQTGCPVPKQPSHPTAQPRSERGELSVVWESSRDRGRKEEIWSNQ